MLRSILIVLLVELAILWLNSPPATATSREFLTFQGLGDLRRAGNLYNGRALPFPENDGTAFSSDVYGLGSVRKGGSSTLVPDPMGTQLILVNRLTGATMINSMKATRGFTSGMHFYYTVGFSETLAGWNEANDTAMVLATMALSSNNRSFIHFPTYCNWSSAGCWFSGTGKSPSFSSHADGIGIFDITGSTSSRIPEPSTFSMFGTGLIGISVATVRRFRRIQKATRPTNSHVCS